MTKYGPKFFVSFAHGGPALGLIPKAPTTRTPIWEAFQSPSVLLGWYIDNSISVEKIDLVD